MGTRLKFCDLSFKGGHAGTDEEWGVFQWSTKGIGLRRPLLLSHSGTQSAESCHGELQPGKLTWFLSHLKYNISHQLQWSYYLLFFLTSLWKVHLQVSLPRNLCDPEKLICLLRHSHTWRCSSAHAQALASALRNSYIHVVHRFLQETPGMGHVLKQDWALVQGAQLARHWICAFGVYSSNHTQL